MATRFYFPASEAAAVEPTIESVDWIGGPAADHRRLTTVKGSSSMGAGTTRGVGTSRPTIDRQYVSDPIVGKTIEGSAKGQLQVREFAASDNVDRLAWKIYVVSGDGGTVRGTLISISYPGSGAEFLSTGFRNRSFTTTPLSMNSVVAQDGDRIVIEIGYFRSGSGTSPQAAGNWGENASDLPEDETQTTDGAGWIEFATNLTLSTPAVATGGEAPDVAAAGTSVVIGAGTVIGGEASAVAGAGMADQMAESGGLELVYLHSGLSADGATPAQFTASGGTHSTATATGLVEADDHWNGALVRWDSGDNMGLWSSVADFDAASDTLQFDDVLPNAVQAGDEFTLFLGGKYASSARIPSLAMPGLVHLTGFDLVAAAAVNGEGTGVLSFDAGDETLTWQPPRADAGTAVDISSLVAGDSIVVYGGGTIADPGSKSIRLERNGDDLPAGDTTDDLSLDRVPSSFLPRVTGAQAAAGLTTYRPFAIRNNNSWTARSSLAWCAAPFPDASSTTLSTGIGTGAATLEAGSLTGWGTSGWVYNTTKDDVRYFYGRSGNAATLLDPEGGHRGFTAAAWDADDELVPFPWIDIGLDAPGSGNLFEDPATSETAPSGVVFSCPTASADGLEVGDLAPTAVTAIWVRLEVPAGSRPLEGGVVEVRLSAMVPLDS